MKRLTLIALVVVLALGATGLVYTAWSQNLTVNGTVSTGTFGVKVETDGAIVQNASNNNVGTCTLTIGDSFDHLHDIVNVTIGNAYPGYTCDAPFKVTNTGSIPVKFSNPAVSGEDGWATWASIQNCSATALSGSQICTFHFAMPADTLDFQGRHDGSALQYHATIAAVQFNQ